MVPWAIMNVQVPMLVIESEELKVNRSLVRVFYIWGFTHMPIHLTL
jgi:hypothetical protein